MRSMILCLYLLMDGQQKTDPQSMDYPDKLPKINGLSRWTTTKLGYLYKKIILLQMRIVERTSGRRTIIESDPFFVFSSCSFTIKIVI